MKCATTLCAGGILCLCSFLAMAADVGTAADATIGRRITELTLQDFRGKAHTLADFDKSRLLVVAFIGTECPLAKLYAPRLAALARQYDEKLVAFVAIDSNYQDSLTEIATYARTHELTFPVLKDPGNKVADHFGAERTPEVFLLDAERIVRYHGRIDDQFGIQANGVAYQRSAPEHRDLAEAIDELLADKEVTHPAVPTVGCRIGRVRQAVADGNVTYADPIAELFNRHCVICHREGQIAPFSLTSYESAKGWADMIREVTGARRMPPWHADPAVGHFANDSRLTDEEIALIADWVDHGAPQGNLAEAPPVPTFATGWLIPEPDEVLFMQKEPYAVPAQGPVPYQRFLLDPGWKEDRWIKAIEPKPGNPAVVHHIVIYLVAPRVPTTGPAGRIKNVLLTATAPGVRPHVWEDGLAQYIPAGSKLLFEVHYTPNGTPQQDQSLVGIVFADPQKIRKEVAVQVAGTVTFAIPPNAPAHEVESFYIFREDSLLLSMSPHMHVRGKDFRYDLQYPDGRTQTVLRVPQYDFGWQTTYVLAEPITVPKGTKMHCVAHYDNSEENLANPDPTQTVLFGEQTWEEMMFGWFDMALVDQDLTKAGPVAVSRVKQFQQNVEVGAAEIDAELESVARRSMVSAENFELLAVRLQELVPQLDRVCVTYVENDELRARQVANLAMVRAPLSTTGAVVKAGGQSLATYPQAQGTVVNADLTKDESSVMKRMVTRGVVSSMHVPVQWEGIPHTINFWSGEPDAFPAAAVELLERVSRLMVAGRE